MFYQHNTKYILLCFVLFFECMLFMFLILSHLLLQFNLHAQHYNFILLSHSTCLPLSGAWTCVFSLCHPSWPDSLIYFQFNIISFYPQHMFCSVLMLLLGSSFDTCSYCINSAHFICPTSVYIWTPILYLTYSSISAQTTQFVLMLPILKCLKHILLEKMKCDQK